MRDLRPARFTGPWHALGQAGWPECPGLWEVTVHRSHDRVQLRVACQKTDKRRQSGLVLSVSCTSQRLFYRTKRSHKTASSPNELLFILQKSRSLASFLFL